MPSVIDLFTHLSKDPNLDFGTLRHVAREMQRDGTLPRGKRGGGRSAPKVTAEDCVMFVLGLAGTANFKEAGTAARRFAKLETDWADKPKSTFLDDLIYQVENYQDRERWLKLKWVVNRLVFAHYAHPFVEVQYLRVDDEKAKPEIVRYSPKKKATKKELARDEHEGGITTATILDGRILSVIADFLGPFDHEELSKLRRAK